MKRFIMFLGIVCVCLAITPAISVFAADDSGEKPPSNVTITVVMPEKAATPLPEATPAPTPEPVKMYPVDVTETIDGAFRQIVKTYELNPDESPVDIPRADFERNGWKYTLTDILRRETASADTREHIEKVTLNTDTKEIEKIIPLLSQTMEFKTADNYVGILELDVASINVETAGTKTTSYTMSVTREYPHLSTNDTELVPKTVTEKGKAYTLAGVDRKVGNYSTVDYERIPDYYTAFATYTATGSSTKAIGYVTTAEYKGSLSKLIQGRPVYTVYFLGEEIRTPLEMVDHLGKRDNPGKTCETAELTSAGTPESTAEPTQTPEPSSVPVDNKTDGENTVPIGWIAVAVLATACGTMFYLLRKQGKGNKPV